MADFRSSLNALSDVITNRPPPIREFDQIYMKAGDMFFQADHCGRWFEGRDVVFIGDGDALALCMVHLHARNVIPKGPRSVTVLDFDDRIVSSINRFARQYGYQGKISAELYNVANPMPDGHRHRYQAFYTNPPFGQFNGGYSVQAFIDRAIECSEPDVHGCVVAADDPKYSWTAPVLEYVQGTMLHNGFSVAEMLPRFHEYHLDDAPDLTSCSMIFRRTQAQLPDAVSASISDAARLNFYGKDAPLKYEYVLDATFGGKFPSKDYRLAAYSTITENEQPSLDDP